MPELPEVETVRRGLTSLVVGKVVTYVHVHLPRIIRHPSVAEFQQRLVGRTFEGVDRRGKYLLFDVRPYELISHLRMEGQYRVVPKEESVAPHTHVVFGLSDGTELRYRDVRQFGTMDLLAEDEPRPTGLVTLGPEPFDPALTPHILHLRLHKRVAPIKSVLLDQSVLAGLGNIYVDEALFLSGIHPSPKPVESASAAANCYLLQFGRFSPRRLMQVGPPFARMWTAMGAMVGFRCSYTSMPARESHVSFADNLLRKFAWGAEARITVQTASRETGAAKACGLLKIRTYRLFDCARENCVGNIFGWGLGERDRRVDRRYRHGKKYSFGHVTGARCVCCRCRCMGQARG